MRIRDWSSDVCSTDLRNMLRDIVKLCRVVGISKRVHIHLTRHTFACHFMRNGGSIYTLSRLLGHSSISTTQTYVRGLGVGDFQEIGRASCREGGYLYV